MYGGPGYPNCDPRLWRIGGINPFPYNGGPGYPTPDHPNYFGLFGPLVVDQPVIKIADDPGYRYDAEVFGPYTGGVANPEAQFAQFTARAAAGAATMRLTPANSPVTPPNPPPDPRLGPSSYIAPPANLEKTSQPLPVEVLGVDEQPVVDSEGVRGMQVSNVHPDTVAERAGLHAGDVIQSVNGYLTTVPGNLAWIIATKAPDGTLSMNVRNAVDGNSPCDRGPTALREQSLRSISRNRLHGVALATFAPPCSGATRTGAPSVRTDTSPSITCSEPSIGTHATSLVGAAT